MRSGPPRAHGGAGARRRRIAAVALAVPVLGSVALALGSNSRPVPSGGIYAEPAPGPAAGSVRFVRVTDPDFGPYLRGRRFAGWMRRHFWRVITYSPYFDSRLRWYRNAWVYRDLYAIYRGSVQAERHPDWILRDAQGSPLYIPFDCTGGTCPQYAGDIGNPSFRSDWIRRARAKLAHGYRGIFLDDVNMTLRVSDGNENEVAPIDPRTGSPMPLADWRRYIAQFTTEIRRAFPRAELVHNVIWFAGDDDAAIRQELAATDVVYIERGVEDPGVEGGGGTYGFETLLAYIDRRHREGKAVVFGGGREYGLATYMLINSGRDGFSSRFRSRPGNWWNGWKIKLGAPRSSRYQWRGLVRRDFHRGLVLVNPPGGAQHTVRLGRPWIDVSGRPRRSILLPAASGVILRKPKSSR
jgi:hypothetical protein